MNILLQTYENSMKILLKSYETPMTILLGADAAVPGVLLARSCSAPQRCRAARDEPRAAWVKTQRRGRTEKKKAEKKNGKNAQKRTTKWLKRVQKSVTDLFLF